MTGVLCLRKGYIRSVSASNFMLQAANNRCSFMLKIWDFLLLQIYVFIGIIVF